MTKYHLSKKFEIAVCHATKKPCPRGAHIESDSLVKVKAGIAETREEKIFQNLSKAKTRVHVQDATPEIEKRKPQQLLSKEQLYALEDYSGMDHFEINQYLAHGIAKPELEKKLSEQVRNIDSAFQLVKPSAPYVCYRGEKITVQEGESFEKAVLREFFPDSEIERKSYLSTSLNPSIASYFSRKGSQSVILEIRAKSGISLKLSDSSNEDEMLLPRDGRYKVVAVRPYVEYQTIDYNEESDYLAVTNQKQQIMTIVLEEV